MAYLPFMDYSEIKSIAERYFTVVDSVYYSIDNVIDIQVIMDDMLKEKFTSFYHEINDKYGLIAILRRISENTCLVRVATMPKKKKRSILMNVIMATITIATILYSGWLFSTNDIFRLIYPDADPFITMIEFFVSLFGIVSIHESGHIIANHKNKIDASLPYFIPGLPQIGGTFGAIIVQRSPPHNRDALFDMGISGPLAGFIVALAVTIIGFLMSKPISPSAVQLINQTHPNQLGELPVPILFSLIEMLVRPTPAGYTLYLHPVAFAGWVGLLITGLNLFPATQLDGGHIARALFGEKNHERVTYASAFIMMLMGYLPMGLLILLMQQMSRHPGPLDDVSKVSNTRKILGFLAFVLVILCTPPLFVFPLF